jgi:hypothetical protein
MRYVVVAGVLVAAAFGIHCSAPTDDPGTSVADITAPAPPQTGTSPSPTHPVEPTDRASASTKTTVPGLEALVTAGLPPTVTSTVKDETGAEYMTGTFVGTIVVANTTLTSKGDKDVFVLKLGPTGAFQWAHAVGSASREHDPRITLAVESNRVTVVGITDGEMDCGTGPMTPWASETSFLCIFARADGAATGSGVFPTGAP